MSDAVEEIRDPNKVYIVWGWDDIQALKPDWSPERCQRALDLCHKCLVDRSVEEGWMIIDVLLDCNSDEIEAFKE